MARKADSENCSVPLHLLSMEKCTRPLVVSEISLTIDVCEKGPLTLMVCGRWPALWKERPNTLVGSGKNSLYIGNQ